MEGRRVFYRLKYFCQPGEQQVNLIFDLLFCRTTVEKLLHRKTHGERGSGGVDFQLSL
jgi:hypothetical protein